MRVKDRFHSMSGSARQRKILGWALVVLVGLGVVAPQLLGYPYVYGHIWDFNWKFGFPCAFLICDGRPSPSSPTAPPLKDITDSHWTTRLLVPITTSSPHEYLARTGVLLTSNARVMKFNATRLLLDMAYAVVLFASAVYLKYRIASTPSLFVYTVRLMAVLTLLCVGYYVCIALTWGSHVCVVLYYPPILALNGLGVFCVIMSLSTARFSFYVKQKDQQGNS